MTIEVPRGTPGQKIVSAKDSFGQVSELTGESGFGYGIKNWPTLGLLVHTHWILRLTSKPALL